jgi:hypothetical protein
VDAWAGMIMNLVGLFHMLRVQQWISANIYTNFVTKGFVS